MRKTVTHDIKRLTETDSPEPSQQNTHSCVLVLGKISPEHLKMRNRTGAASVSI